MPDEFEKQLPRPQRKQKAEEQFVGMSCICGETFLVPLSVSGNAAVCPRCNARVRLPEENFVRVICSCGKPFKIPAVLSGRKGICPQCGRQIKIPGKSEETSGGTVFSVQAGISDYKDTLSDDQLEEIGSILLADKLKTGRSTAETEAAPTIQPAQVPAGLLKGHENLRFRVTCKCGNHIVQLLSQAHEPIECPSCQRVFRLAEKHFIQMNCPCGTELRALRILKGASSKCPTCGKILEITTK
mgnify:CR=1 FL=1